jgi:serine/threonine-protein kinase
MPPLQAPDEDDWGPQDEKPSTGRRRRALWIAAAAVLLLLLAGGTWFLLADPTGNGGNDAGVTSASTSAESTATAVTIDLPAYLGRDADEVQAELEREGFTVTQAAASEATVAEGSELVGRELAAGQVADIAPAGENVPTTATVTIYVVPEAATGGGDTTTEPTQTTTSSPETTSSAPTTTTTPPPTTETTTPTTESTTLGGTTTSAPAVTTTEEPPPADPNAGAADPGGAG